MRLRTVGALCVLPLALGLMSCGGNSSTPVSTTNGPTPVSASTIYVIQNVPVTGASSLLTFAATGNGSVTPLTTITAPTNYTFDCVAVDASGNMYVGSHYSLNNTNGNGQLFVYAAGATGTATPTRSVYYNLGPGTQPLAIAVDASGQAYLADGPQIHVIAANANGQVSPVKSIYYGSMFVTGLAVDSSDNVYATSTDGYWGTNNGDATSHIFEFAPSANGTSTPTRTITMTGQPHGVALDPSGNIWASTEYPSAISEYGPTASGSATPTKQITGGMASIDSMSGIEMDSNGYLYTVVDSNSNVLSVNLYASGAASTNGPTASLTSTAWTYSETGQVAIH